MEAAFQGALYRTQFAFYRVHLWGPVRMTIILVLHFFTILSAFR